MSEPLNQSQHRRLRGMLRLGVGVISVITMVLATDLVWTSGHTARGAVVAGHEVGDLSDAELAPELAELMAQASKPITIRTTSGAATIDPAELGLQFDAEATAAELRRQPRSPIDRLLALFGRSTQVNPVVHVDPTAFGAALDARRDSLERAAVEGGVRYDGARPVAEMPKAGLRVDRDAARELVAREWLTGDVVVLPMEPFSPTVSADTVTRTVAGEATRATADDIVVIGRGVAGPDAAERVRLSPTEIGSILTFVPDGSGGLVSRVDPDRGRTELNGLRSSERRPRDATFSLASGAPTVIGSHDGAAIDWDKTLAAVEKAVVQPAGATTASQRERPRSVEAAYTTLKPRLTTEAARRLGVRDVVSEFTTGGFSSASGENIRIVAGEVDGALILPGKNFSLNGYTGPRGSAQGYVTSGIIDHGRADKAVGGGISQFATTLYNAAYFAGLEDVDHTEHSYYISRYPEAREATVFEGAIDLVIGNNTSHGVYIETLWDSSSVTVRMWSTRAVEVQSLTGDRFAYTDPPSLTLPAGDNCVVSSGSRGFTTSNTRVISDVRTGAETSRNTRTVKYDPEPRVRCV